jgi:hypothetical protein
MIQLQAIFILDTKLAITWLPVLRCVAEQRTTIDVLNHTQEFFRTQAARVGEDGR